MSTRNVNLRQILSNAMANNVVERVAEQARELTEKSFHESEKIIDILDRQVERKQTAVETAAPVVKQG